MKFVVSLYCKQIREGRMLLHEQPKNAAKAADGLTHTHWLSDKTDKTPTLTFEFDDPIKTRWLILTQPLQKRDDINRMGLIRQVEVSCNGKKPFLIDMHPNPLAATERKMSKTYRVRTMTVKIRKRGGKPGLPVGFAEIMDIKWMREAEIKHGRVAMLATIGYTYPEMPWFAQAFPGDAYAHSNPIKAALAVPPEAWAQVLLFCGVMEYSLSLTVHKS